MNRKLLFIVNPLSGKGLIKNKLLRILDVFIKAGYRIDIHLTQCRGDALKVTRDRAAGTDLVVCSGGDGTMNETVSGLMELPEDKRPVLGYIPAGTTNDFAKSLHLPKDMLRASEIAVTLPGISTDIGRIEDRYFTYVAGFGAFTSVSYTTPQDSKNMLGHPAYIFEGLKCLSDIKPYHVKVEYDGGNLEGEFLIGLVTNSVSVAGFPSIAGKNVALDDGLFEVILIRKPKNPVDLTSVLTELFQEDKEHNFVYKLKTEHIRFRSDEPIDWVLDGEYGGARTTVDIYIQKKALKIIRK